MPISAAHFSGHFTQMTERIKVILSNGGGIDTVIVLIDVRPDQQSTYTLYCDYRDGKIIDSIFIGMFPFPKNVYFSAQEFQESFMMHVVPVVGPLIPDTKWIFKEIL